MLDLWGHLSARVPSSDLVMVTPRFSQRCLPRSVTASDILVSGAAGSGELPLGFETDLAIYRQNPKRQACLFAAPRFAMAAAIARYALKPLTHMESVTSFGAETSTGGDKFAEAIARATA